VSGTWPYYLSFAQLCRLIEFHVHSNGKESHFTTQRKVFPSLTNLLDSPLADWPSLPRHSWFHHWNELVF